MHEGLTAAEACYCQAIAKKDSSLRDLLAARNPDCEPAAMFDYLVAIKNTLGNINNDISFVASLLVKPFLRKRFGIEFDAALKPQGARHRSRLHDARRHAHRRGNQDDEALPARIRRCPETGNHQGPFAALLRRRRLAAG
jgi:hypothetical protein